jgi:hypothetical protein
VRNYLLRTLNKRCYRGSIIKALRHYKLYLIGIGSLGIGLLLRYKEIGSIGIGNLQEYKEVSI